MADVVEASFDVSLQNPFRGNIPWKDIVTLGYCILATAILTEAVGMLVACRFRNRVESHQIESLHRTVFHRRDSQGAFLPVLLRYFHTTQGHRLIATAFECVNSFDFCRIGWPSYMVNSCGVFTLISSNPNYGKIATVERVGQQPLQGFDLAVSAFPLSLYNTCLQLPNILLSLVSVNAFPTFGIREDHIFRRTLFFRFVHLHSFL